MRSFRTRKRSGVPEGRVELPASKSISNRLLILSHLSGGRIKVQNPSQANDTILLRQALQDLEEGDGLIDAADAGTAYRFLTALLSCVPGTWALEGSERMKERPIAPLVDALRHLGAKIDHLEKDEYPPLRIQGGGLEGGHVSLRADRSSQYLSALALIAPAMEKGLEIEYEGNPVSMPYFGMTLSLLRDLEVPVEEEWGKVRIHPSSLPARNIEVEGDHSSAAFWYELVAVAGKGALFLEGIQSNSIQGDAELPAFFMELGVKERWERGGCWIEAIPGDSDQSPYETDLRHHPDLFPPLLVTCVALQKKAVFHGVGHLRDKESDRLQALQEELLKIGVRLVMEGDQVGLDPRGLDRKAEPFFRVHGDHRLAMAFAPLASVFPSLCIDDPDVVEKSYPGFWEVFDRVLPPSG